MERKYRVYRYQNLIVPSASYIGKTCAKHQSTRTGKDGSRYKVCPKFWDGIQTYSWPNFEYSVLEDGLTKEEAEIREQYWIAYYDSVNQGYNITNGGAGSLGVHCSDETRKKLSDSHKGIIFSDERRKKLSDVNKGKSLSDETKKKMAISHGVNGVLQYTKDGQFIKEYPSMMEAYRRTGINPGNISKCCQGKTNSAGGSIWKLA